MMLQLILTHTQILQTSETILQGHRDSVNAIRFNADLTFLLSGGTLYAILFVYHPNQL